MSSSLPSIVIKHPVFRKSLLIKSLSFTSTLHAAPAHFVMRILLCHAVILSCHSSKLSFSSSHLSIFSTNFVLYILPNPASIGCILSVWFSGRRYTIALSSCLQASWNCLSCWNVTLSANITFSSGDLPMPGASVLATHYKSHVNLTVHPGTALEVDINPLIILSFLFCTHISFSTEYNGWLDILLPLCTNTKLQCSLSLVQAT